MLDDLLAEGRARRQPAHHLLQRLFGLADGAHAVMDAARTETALRDLEAAALTEQQIGDGNADILQQHLGVAVRRIVEAEHRQHLLDRDALGVERNQDLRLLLMLGRLEIGLAHQDRDLAAGIADAGRPPFAAVDHIMIAVTHDAGLDVGRVRRRHRRLGHQEGGADFAVHQGAKPFALLLLVGITHQHFHVAGIRRRAIEHFRGPIDVAHLLGQQRVFQVGQSRAAEFVVFVRRRRHEHVPEAFGPRLFLQLFQHRNDFPALAGRILLLVGLHRGANMRVHERRDALEPFTLAIRQCKVHQAILAVCLKIFATVSACRPTPARALSKSRGTENPASKCHEAEPH